MVMLAFNFFSSCTLETSDNGNLDGFWHLDAVDTLYNNTAKDYSKEKIYWAFQNKLFQISDAGGNDTTVLFRFNYTGDSLHVYNPYFYIKQGDDEQVQDVTSLKPFGINSLSDNFKVIKLTSNKMILRSTVLYLYFSKL